MRTSVPSPLYWSRLNESWKSQLGLPEELGCRVYNSYSLALFEAFVGTALFFNHKRSVGLVHGNSWSTLEQAPFFYKESYKVITCGQSQSSDWKTWVSQLPTDTVAVNWSYDHPITGAVLSGADEFDQLLNERKIYSICSTHSMALSGKPARPYTVRAFDLWDNFGWLEYGARFRTPSLISQHDRQIETPTLESLASKRFNANETVINAFESKDIKGSQALQSLGLFSSSNASVVRHYDRALFAHAQVHGGLLIEELSQRLGLSKGSDLGSLMMTTNVVAEGKFHQYRTWWEGLPSDEILRGLVVIDQSLLAHLGFEKTFSESVDACLSKFA